MRDMGGLVALAAERDGSEEGSVGLDQDAVGGVRCGRPADGDGPGVGEVAGEGEVEAEVEGVLCLGLVAGEAVHDAGEVVRAASARRGGRAGRPRRLRAAEGLVFGLGGGDGELGGAAVDDDGLAGSGGDPELGDEGGVLGGDVGVVEVVVVEADLADGDAARVCGERRRVFAGLRGWPGGPPGMDAGGGADLGSAGWTWWAISRARCMVSGPSPMPMARMVVTPAGGGVRARTCGRSS